MLTIGYFADGPWSHKAIERLVQMEAVKLAFIVPRYDTQDPVLKGWADKLHIPFIPHENVNQAEFLDTIAALNADLYVSMSFNQILKPDIIEHSPLGFINCHAGALPFYRGRNPLNWVLINGEKEFGITAHYVDEGIDTGDIIKQQKYPIGLDDNYGSLLQTAISGCADVLLEAIEDIRDHKVNRVKQSSIHAVGTYFGMRKMGDEILNFAWPSERVFNFVRAIADPGPCARIFVNDKEFKIHSAELIDDAPNYIATIGEVCGRSERGCIVKTGTSTVLLTKVSESEGGGYAAPCTPKFRIGTRFKVMNMENHYVY